MIISFLNNIIVKNLVVTSKEDIFIENILTCKSIAKTNGLTLITVSVTSCSVAACWISV